MNDTESVYALLDTGSSNSFCSQRLIDKLGVDGIYQKLNVSTLSDSVSKNSKLVQLDVVSKDGSQMKLSGVYVVDNIPVKSVEIDVHMFDHLNGIEFQSLSNSDTVDLLIGQDHSEALIPLEVRKGKPGEPFAIRSVLGWCLNGSAHGQCVSTNVVSNFISINETKAISDELHENVQRLWQIENDGIDPIGLSQQDKLVLGFWEKSTHKVDGHFEMPIPWENSNSFPNNINLAVGRFRSLMKRLQREELMDRYDEEITKLVEKGYAEKVPSNKIDAFPGPTWYLPHHHVISDKKPGKLRVVFDCASRFQGESLNDRVLQGPDLVNKLINVLVRFRQHSFAIQADVEAMYNQVRVPKSDRDALRFLWMNDDEVVHYRMTSHLFGGKWCASSFAYALRRTAQDSASIDPSVREAIERNFYVDDVLHSCASSEDARLIIHETPKVLHEGGFNLTKFVVNDDKLLDEISVEHRAKELSHWSPNVQGKVLGVKWNICSDSFFFEIKEIDTKSVSRRKILSVVSSIFDPLGLVGPLVLPGKLIFQDATRLKMTWDDEVPVDIRTAWQNWVESLRGVSDINFPRCVKPKEFDMDAIIELHHFADASTLAYGSCSYIRCINKFGQVHTQLLVSKSRVAPLKHMTIPRLELQAALLAAKSDAWLRTEMNIHFDGSYFWSDSKVVLGYIKNESSRFHVFVANRVSQIRDLTNPDMWNYVSTDCNPADLLTRTKWVSNKTLDQKWFHGPHWLSEYKCNWPSDEHESNVIVDTEDPEVKTKIVSHTAVCQFDDDLIFRASSHYSNWYKMRRAVAWLCRFILQLGKSSETGNLKIHEIEHARLLLIKNAQRKCYADEFRCLSAGRDVTKSSPLHKLNPFLDEEGIIRVGGRIREHCIVIPHQHPISRAIVLYVHNRAHVGVEWTLGKVREKYWIVKARPLVKKIVRSCVTCRKLYANPCTQKMADLPLERLQPNQPVFTNVGVDVFGPISVKNYRSELKRYGCLFTCLATRAIHVEKFNNLEADTFINTFRRFTARRGKPHKVFSDNGLNIVGGEKEMCKARNQLLPAVVKSYIDEHNIEWSFIPPSAPHMGGAWERMIGLVKRALKAILLNESRLSDEVLETLFCEVESIVNGRPLTKLSDDVNDWAPITPNHLLLLRNGPVIPPGKFDKSDMYRRRWRYAQHLADVFWHKWVKLYLPELQKRVKWTEINHNVSLGDLVLIADENTPRNLWPLAIVDEVLTGRDDLVRSVRLRTRTTKLVRPITKIILLEGAVISKWMKSSRLVYSKKYLWGGGECHLQRWVW